MRLFCLSSLSYRDVEEMLFARGIVVTYEAIRKWCRKFGQDYANQIRRSRLRTGDKWYLDEVFLTIKHFQPRRHLLSASEYHDERRNRFESWAEITGTERAV